MKILILIGLILLMIVGCSKHETIVIGSDGKKYRLVEREKVMSNNIIQTELWERIEPENRSCWYTPTLSSKINTNSPPMFNSLRR